jgi:hypothetical protein
MADKLTTDRITEMVGRLSEERIVQILDTGAIEIELLEAKLMAAQEDIEGAPRSEARMEVVHALYDILRADMTEREER